MFIMRFVLNLLILPAFICPPQVFAQGLAAPKKNSAMLYQKVLQIAEKKADLMSRSLPAGNVMIVQSEKNKAVKEELIARISKMEASTNAEVAEFKKSMVKLNEQELSEMSHELQGYLNAMTETEIMKLAETLKESRQYEDEAMQFTSAFTLNEKRMAIKSALQDDLGFLRSVYNKKLAKATKEELKKDLQTNLNTFAAQSSNKADTKKILQISLIALAGIALATWGISSAVYGARLSRIRSDREAKLSELQKNLNAQYQAYKDQLTTEEMNFLKSNGYVRVVCGTYDQPDSILCNRYDYKVFSGQKHCQVYCYRSLTTGKETLHEPAICTSPWIPSDCYDPKEYWDAYARGEDDGYADGYDSGYSRGEDDGSSDGYYDGKSDGYDDGYDDGYAYGYDDGYDSGYSPMKRRGFIPLKVSEEYLKGFKDGLEQYRILFLNI